MSEHSDRADRIVEMVDRLDTLSFPSISGASADAMRCMFKEGKQPVSIQQFLDDDYYFGKAGKELYPANRPDIEDIFDPKKHYTEIIFTGATSIGKTFCACIAVAYIVYLLSHYITPQLAIGGSEATDIIFINMSVSARKAEGVVFNQIKNLIDRSPYFREQFKRDMSLSQNLVWRVAQPERNQKTGSAIRFIPGTSDSLSALGENIYGGVLDELNFFRIVAKSVKAFGSVYDPAKSLYDVISRRIKGRYTSGGKTLGKIFLLSSSMYPDDFISRRIEECERDGSLGDTVKVVKKSEWEAKRGVFIGGKPVHSEQTFRVEVGSTRRSSRILDFYDKARDEVVVKESDDIEGRILHVPVDFWDFFFRDVEGSVRDFGGETTRAISPFFPDTELVYACIDPDLKHPYSRDETTLRDGVEFLRDVLFVKDEKTGRWRPKRHPSKPRYFHGDLGITGDPAGFSVVHVAGWMQVQLPGGEMEDRPIYETDLILRVIHPMGGEVMISDIRAILKMLRSYGMYFGKGSFDQFQSVSIMQELRAEGFTVEKLSIIADNSPYLTFKDAVFEKRFKMYEYEPLLTEMRTLERHEEKIGHPPNGCFTGDTEIALVDGRNVSFEQLVDEDSRGIENWTYSVDCANRRIIPKRILRPRQTFVAEEIVEVVLDNCERIKCTPDHRFMLRTGSYVEAKDLTVGNSLMPLYRKLSANGLLGYELLYDPFDNAWHFTHRYFLGQLKKGQIVHHVDYNKRNNETQNLQVMLRKDHRTLHNNTTVDYTKLAASIKSWHLQMRGSSAYEERRERIRQSVTMYWIQRRFAEKALYSYAAGTGRKMWFRSAMKLCPAIRFAAEYIRRCERSESIQKYNLSDYGRQFHSERMRNLNYQKRGKTFEELYGLETAEKLRERARCRAAARRQRANDFSFAGQSVVVLNHKVVSVSRIMGSFPVYDLTVEGTKNFALSEGVFVHNSDDTIQAVVGATFNAFSSELSTSPVTREARMPIRPTHVQSKEETMQSILSDFEKWARS